MRDIADCLTLRRLRGGVKIRASEFLGGGGMPPIIVISPPPATASRSHPPPQAAEGKNSFLSKKEFPFPRKRESPYPLIVKNDAVRALLAPANREIPAFAGMEEGDGNGRGGREWKRGAGMKKGAGMEEGSGNLLNPPPTFSNRRGIAFLSGGLKCGRIRRRLCRRRGGRGGRSRWRPRRHGCRRECPPAM